MLHTRFKEDSPVLSVGSCHGTQPKVTGLSALPRKPNLDKPAACCAPPSTDFSRGSTGAMQQQTVKGHGFGLEGVELDLRELAFFDFAPAVDAGLSFLSFSPVQSAQELVGIVARGDLAIRGTGEGFDGVAAQKFAPVVIEEIAGSEDVTPGDFPAVSHHYANDTFTL